MRVKGQWGQGDEDGDNSVIIIFITSSSHHCVFLRLVRTRGKGAVEEGEDKGTRVGQQHCHHLIVVVLLCFLEGDKNKDVTVGMTTSSCLPKEGEDEEEEGEGGRTRG